MSSDNGDKLRPKKKSAKKNKRLEDEKNKAFGRKKNKGNRKK